MHFRKHLSVVKLPDIRLTPFTTFLEGIIRHNPYMTVFFSPHDEFAEELCLQGYFDLRPEECEEFLERILRQYGIPSSEFLRWRIQHRDHSLGELYQLLWGAANLANPDTFKPFPRSRETRT